MSEDEDEDDDWFERALGEEPSEDAPEDWDDWAGDSDAPEPAAGADVGPAAAEAATETEPTDDGETELTADGETELTDDGEPDTTDGGDTDTTDGGAGSGAGDEADDGGEGGDGTDLGEGGDGAGGADLGEGGDGAGVADPGDGDTLFEDDFAAAMGGAPDLDVDDGDGMGGGMGMDDEMGGGGFGGGMDDLDVGGGGEFDMGGGGDFGMGGGPSAGFEADEDLESDLDRIDLGIEGLDEMIQGGIPDRSLMVTIGSAGTGKTTFALQFLHQALQQGERAIYITLEESRERVINSATEKGLQFDEYVDAGQLAVVDLDPVEMANSLRSIRSELPRLIKSFDATRLVLDSVSLLEMMYDDRAKRRNEIYDFTRSLKNAGVTTMLTSEADDDNPYTSRHGIVEYLTDAVFVLQYVRPSDFRETRLAIEIQKIRDANHSRETKPYEITNEGISVYRQANIF